MSNPGSPAKTKVDAIKESIIATNEKIRESIAHTNEKIKVSIATTNEIIKETLDHHHHHHNPLRGPSAKKQSYKMFDKNESTDSVTNPFEEEQSDFQNKIENLEETEDDYIDEETREEIIKDIRQQGAIVEWHSVNMWVMRNRNLFEVMGNKPKYPPKQILYNVTGMARPGKMLALMGASGSGKTSLMNLLNKLIPRNMKYTGKVLVNGRKRMIRNYSAFIQQENLFYPYVSVEEHMRFHAEFRMGSHFSEKQKQERIDSLTKQFGIDHCMKVVMQDVGVSAKSLSGGEKKRLAIITELLTDPPILFLDEPTSGLDSYIATSVIKSIKKLAEEGKTIICTVHQPSSEAFGLFDDILLLAQGKTAYFGSVADVCNYFAQIDYPLPEATNPADHIVAMVSYNIEEPEESQSRIARITDYYAEKYPDDDESADFSRRHNSAKSDGQFALKSNRKKSFFFPYKAKEHIQFYYLFKRVIMTSVRQPLNLICRMIQDLATALIIGLLYFGLSYSVADYINFAGVTFFECAGLTLNAVLTSVVTFPEDYRIFAIEHRVHLYRTTMYYLAKTFGELPFQLLQNLVFTFLIYFLINFRQDAQAFLYHLFFVIFIYQGAMSYGYLLSSLTGSMLAALAISSPLLIPLMAFGGFLMTDDQIPPYLRWIKYLSWFQFGYSNILLVNYHDAELICESFLERVIFNCPTGRMPAEGMLRTIGVRASDFYNNIVGLIVLVIVYRVVAIILIILKIFVHEKWYPT